MKRLAHAPRRRLGASVLAVAVIGSLMLVAAPAQAATPNLRFTPRPFFIERGGVNYKVEVSAFRNPDDSSALNVAISKKKNPDGPAKGIAYEIWSRVISNFSATDNLSDGEFHPTGAEMEGFGTINMDWAASDPLVQSCQGHLKSRKGAFHGNFKFKTNTGKFGTIIKDKLKGKLSTNDGDCPGTGGNNDCPQQIRSFQSFMTDFFWFGGEQEGAATVGLVSVRGKDLANQWRLNDQVYAYLPPSNFDVSDDTLSGMITGAEGTFTKGTSNYTAEGSTDSTPDPCGTGKESFTRNSQGSFAGNFTFNFLLGGDHSVTGDASAQRIIVRDAV